MGKNCLEWRLSEIKGGVELLEHMPGKVSSPWDEQIIYHQVFFLLRIKNRTQDPPKTCHFSIPSFSLNFSMSLTRSHVVFSSKHALLDWLSVQTNIEVNKPLERTVSTFLRLADRIRRSESMHWALFRDFKNMQIAKTLYFCGLKKVRSAISTPPPGPPVLQSQSRYRLHVIDAQTMNENDWRSRDVSPNACCVYLGATNQDFRPCYPRFRNFEWKKNHIVESPFQRKIKRFDCLLESVNAGNFQSPSLEGFNRRVWHIGLCCDVRQSRWTPR